MLSVGVVGDTNCGKSTLLNALLGSRVLPSRGTSCTSVLTHCVLDGGARGNEVHEAACGEAVLVHEGGVVAGTSTVRAKIEELSDWVRSEGDGRIIDLLVHCGARPELMPAADGLMKFIDVPGHNESDNSVVRECKDIVTSLCHGLMILVKYDSISSAATAELIQSLAEDAPHLFVAPGTAHGLAHVLFVITQVDHLEHSDGLDGDDDDSNSLETCDLKENFRAFLRRRPCLQRFQGFADTVPILATGITREVLAGRKLACDMGDLLSSLVSMHNSREALIESRKVRFSHSIFLPFKDALETSLTAGDYPVIASDVLERHSEQRRKLVMAAVSMGTLAVGGWMACAAWAARGVALAQAATASASAASASAAAAAAAATAQATGASAASIAAASSSVGSAAAGLGTAAGLAADAGLVASPALGAGLGLAAKWLSFTALGGYSASKAARTAAAAAASASAVAVAAAAEEATASAAAVAAASLASSATAAVAAYTGLALAGGVAAMRAALVGNQVIVTAPGLGCLGAGRALDAMETPDAEAIRESEAEDGKPYQDFLMWPDSEEHVLYAGQFRGKLPHGTGRLFWKETQVESFVGEFRWGRLREGVFISKHQVAIGRLREVEEESSGSEARLVVAGFQPESAYDPTEPCAICLERPSILTEGRVMVPCHHGCVCSPCLPGVSECPLCRAQVSGTVRVC